ncbi:MAG: GNAT family N-acetyltransferase [Bacteroidaceae bacterium]|nr:GNAT family N-acetyltransferase [Bacteroidaceae bacterium]
MIRIVTFAERFRLDFIRLNTEWIETYFRLEESDLRTFAQIDDYILRPGGQIFIALNEEGTAVGCCALIPHPGHSPEEAWHELAKMAVTPSAQGQGVGRQLGEALIAYARSHGVRLLRLEGNTHLAASIALYRKLGFREVPLHGQAYDRCDILMELNLR